MDIKVSALEDNLGGHNTFAFAIITEGTVEFSFLLDRGRAKKFADMINKALETNESQQENPI